MEKTKSHRSTQAKQAIHSLIEQSEVGLSHGDIETSLEGLCNRVTIYRVLDRLLEEGKVHKLIDVDGVTKYMACLACTDEHVHHHVHFSCQECGQVKCLHHVVPNFELPEGYALGEVNFMVTGTCPSCSLISLEK